MGLASAGAFFCLFAGLRLIGAVRAAIVAALEPLSTAALSFVFLDEPLRAGTLAGGALILAGATAAGVARRAEPEPETAVPWRFVHRSCPNGHFPGDARRATIVWMLPVEADRARVQTVASPRLLLLFGGLGVAFDLAANGQWPGASIPVFVALVAVAMRPLLRRTATDDVLLGAAVAFSIFPALRASMPLAGLDVVASAALLALVAVRDQTNVFRASLESFLRRALHLVSAAVRVPAAILVPVARGAARIQPSRARRAFRAIAIALPVLAVFAALLASADRVFGDLLLPNLPAIDLSGVGSHVGLTIVGIAFVATLWRASTLPMVAPFFEDRPSMPSVGFAEWTTVLGGIVALFALFVGVQFAVLFGGHHRVDVTPGLTYAQYARSGFFQLMAVAALTAVVILGGWDLGRREGARQERTFRWLVSAMVALTGVILGSAFVRLALYEGTFGFTVPRLGAYVVICWIGFVLLVLLAAIWSGARHRVIPMAIVGGVLALLVVNAINPERFVAERNVARFEATGKIDVPYFRQLGPDAVPVAMDLWPRLDSAKQPALWEYLCGQAGELSLAPHGWRSYNLGRSQAVAALATLGVRPCEDLSYID
jgi:hypothetical protein